MRHRLPLAAALVALAVFSAGCGDEEVFEEESRTSLALPPQTRVVVENARGAVRLVPSPDSNIRIEARKRAVAPTDKRARELASQVRVDVEREGDEFRVLVHFPERIGRRAERRARRERASVYLDLYVPENTPIRVNTVSADLATEKTRGVLEFRSTSGDLNVERHQGPLLVQTVNGDVSVVLLEGVFDMKTTSGDVDAVSLQDTVRFDATSGSFSASEILGPLTVSAVSGDVEAGNVRGEVRVSTASGDVAVGTSSGIVEVSTTSGDVAARLDTQVSRAQVETTSGDVEMTLPPAAGGGLDVTTATGDVTTRLRMKLERATRRQLSGVLGEGGPARVSIRTSSGDITIDQEPLP